MIDKKQRIKLRSLAMNIKPNVIIGKEGISESALKQIEEDLFDHELTKVSFLESSTELSEFELCEMATKLGANLVTKIGKKVVLYKHSEKKNIKHVLD